MFRSRRASKNKKNKTGYKGAAAGLEPHLELHPRDK
jgi:hypothetical protein